MDNFNLMKNKECDCLFPMTSQQKKLNAPLNSKKNLIGLNNSKSKSRIVYTTNDSAEGSNLKN